jgi:hypothetical protein
MILIQPEHKLTISFSNTETESDIVTFISIIGKCAKEAKKSGFRSMFSAEESTVIKAVHEVIKT